MRTRVRRPLTGRCRVPSAGGAISLNAADIRPPLNMRWGKTEDVVWTGSFFTVRPRRRSSQVRAEESKEDAA
jgi:hypothetical protein